MPFSVTGTGLTDFVIARSGAERTPTVSSAVIAVMPAPSAVAVFVIAASVARGANSLTCVSYTMTAFPPAGTLIPVMDRGGPAVTAGAA